MTTEAPAEDRRQTPAEASNRNPQESSDAPGPGEDHDGWVSCHHSGPLNLNNLFVEDIDVRDIVHGLHRINRFNGQTREPVTMLWHALMVAELCPKDYEQTVAEGLFHNAAEAYVGDCIRPLTNLLSPRLTALRTWVQYVSLMAVGLDRPGAWMSPTVRSADDLMYRYELHAPWGLNGVTWHTPPTAAEHEEIEAAAQRLEAAGMRRPGASDARGSEAERACRLTFLRKALTVVPEDAPIRKSIDDALAADGTNPARTR